MVTKSQTTYVFNQYTTYLVNTAQWLQSSETSYHHQVNRKILCTSWSLLQILGFNSSVATITPVACRKSIFRLFYILKIYSFRKVFCFISQLNKALLLNVLLICLGHLGEPLTTSVPTFVNSKVSPLFCGRFISLPIWTLKFTIWILMLLHWTLWMTHCFINIIDFLR